MIIDNSMAIGNTWCILQICKLTATTCQYFHLYRNGKTLKTDCQKKTWSTFTLECIFRKIGLFSNVHFQEKIMNK